jgi:hypothetical protein
MHSQNSGLMERPIRWLYTASITCSSRIARKGATITMKPLERPLFTP